MIEQEETPKTFFRQAFFTFNHAETGAKPFSEQFADGGAVDLVYMGISRVFKPEITEKTPNNKKVSKLWFSPRLYPRLGAKSKHGS